MAKHTSRKDGSPAKATETKLFRMKVDLPNVFAQLASEVQPGYTMGFRLALISLNRIAERAIAINDTVILTELEAMGIIHENEETPCAG